MKSLSLLLLLVIVLLSSCGQSTKTLHANGQLHEEYQVDKQGQRHGSYVRYDDAGNLFEEANYEHGVLQGDRTIYYPTGEREVSEVYLDGLLHGMYRKYYKTGGVQLEVEYTHNVMNAVLKGYYEDGTLREEVIMKDNNENGPFVEYHPSGQIHWKGTYYQGDNEVGLLEEYDPNGKLIKKMMCDSASICQTIWTLSQGEVVPVPVQKLIEQ